MNKTTVQATNRVTGEVIELPAGTIQEISDSWSTVEGTMNTYRELRSLLTNRGMSLLKQIGEEHKTKGGTDGR